MRCLRDKKKGQFTGMESIKRQNIVNKLPNMCKVQPKQIREMSLNKE